MSPLLTVEHLRVEIATRRTNLVPIDDISFDIAPGEVLGVVGESGAGKSITGTAIIGLLDHPARMTAGRITLEGQRIDNLPTAAMRSLRGKAIGAVFQDPLTSLNPLMPVGRQIVQTLTTHMDLTASQAHARAIRLLTEVGIPAAKERMDSYPHELSGGMRQRVVLALAFSCEPKLVIADEPTTALDVSIQAQVIDLLKRMCRERGTAVLLITHDMGVIAETADRVAVMYAGRIVEIGTVDHVLTAPYHPYTRGLTASIPRLRRRTATLPQIAGNMPRLDALPTGCAFHPRCLERLPRCAMDRPDMLPAGTGSAACWLVTPTLATATRSEHVASNA